MNIWNEYKTYPIKINNNLWTVYSTLVLIVIAFYAAAAEEERSQWIQCFLLWSWCHACFLSSLWARCFRQSLPGCHCRSRGAIFGPSSPVIGHDGCKTVLLRNMSRAGEGEVGVESRKGQRPKASPRASSCSRTLWHPSHAAGTLKQVVKPPPTERANLYWNGFIYF